MPSTVSDMLSITLLTDSLPRSGPAKRYRQPRNSPMISRGIEIKNTRMISSARMSTGMEVIISPRRHTSNWFTVAWRSRFFPASHTSAAPSRQSLRFFPRPLWPFSGLSTSRAASAAFSPGLVVKVAPAVRLCPSRSSRMMASSRLPPVRSRASRHAS